jgi:hypothetical protein
MASEKREAGPTAVAGPCDDGGSPAGRTAAAAGRVCDRNECNECGSCIRENTRRDAHRNASAPGLRDAGISPSRADTWLRHWALDRFTAAQGRTVQAPYSDIGCEQNGRWKERFIYFLRSLFRRGVLFGGQDLLITPFG